MSLAFFLFVCVRTVNVLQTEIYVASIKDRATSMQIIRQAVEEKIPMYLWAMDYFSRKDENSAETKKKNLWNVNSGEVSEAWFYKLFQIFFEKYFRNFSKSQLKIHLMY